MFLMQGSLRRNSLAAISSRLKVETHRVAGRRRRLRAPNPRHGNRRWNRSCPAQSLHRAMVILLCPKSLQVATEESRSARLSGASSWQHRRSVLVRFQKGIPTLGSEENGIMEYIPVGGLKVAKVLHDFIE